MLFSFEVPLGNERFFIEAFSRLRRFRVLVGAEVLGDGLLLELGLLHLFGLGGVHPVAVGGKRL